MKKLFIYLLLLVSIFLVSCGASKALDGDPSSSPREPGDHYAYEIGPSIADSYLPSPEAGGYKTSEGDAYEGWDDVSTGEEKPNEEYPQAGQLTASAVFDNDNYNFWKTLITRGQEAGLFYGDSLKYPFDSTNRIKITVPKINNAKVSINNKYFGITDSNGVVYLFPEKADSYDLSIVYTDNNGKKFTYNDKIEGDFTLENPVEQMKTKEKMQILFVVDTTGSMGDEIRYLKSELKDVINTIKQDLGNIQIEIGFVFYRDYGDQYVTDVSNFSTNIDSKQKDLDKQYADGGGDWEEAVQEAFIQANKLDWDMEAKSRLIVWVADAPCHDKDADTVKEQTDKFCEKGIRVITVASSGIDKCTEYLFRSICIATNGCYGYLTNDSGIGYEHTEATTEEKPVVEYLNKMLIRLIKGFYTGEFEEPVAWRGQE